MSKSSPVLVALDPGARAFKACTHNAQLLLPSVVATNGVTKVYGLSGLRNRKRPAKVMTHQGEYLVGVGAHDFGRAVENLDFERLTGTPELQALFYATLSQLFNRQVPKQMTLLIGLPIGAMSGESGKETIKRIKDFFRAAHEWQIEDESQRTSVEQVEVTGQPVGAVLEYFLNADGSAHPVRREDYKKEVGVINLGMSTVDLLSCRQGQVIERMTGGDTLGVQEMLIELSQQTGYTLAELDEQLRRQQLDLSQLLPVWERRVFGYIGKVWGTSYRRFARVIATGGGTYLLQDALMRRFGSRLYIAPDPVMSTAIGLYRFGLKHLRKDS